LDGPGWLLVDSSHRRPDLIAWKLPHLIRAHNGSKVRPTTRKQNVREPILAATVFVALLVIILALVWANQRRLMYFPTTEAPALGATGLTDVERVTFKTTDGLSLGGWFVRATGPPPPITILVFNGNAGHRGYRAPLAAALHRHGMQVFLFDYRGYGGNPGTPTEKGLAADSRASRAFLAARPDVDASRMVYFGESLGTAVAVELATEHPPAALVLRSPFTSMADVGRHHYPFLPVRLLLRDRFPTLERIGQIRAPLLVIAGGRDRIIPLENSRRVYEAATAPKTLLVIPDADHNDEELLAGDEMIRTIARFLQNPT
jgi:fermentation-respiration switch protein FrsA (DUF1100 family)